MNRREFIKILSVGALAIYVSGCGSTAAVKLDAQNDPVDEQSTIVSGGSTVNIVVINSSPHSEAQSTSRYLAKRFIDGAASKGHNIFVFDAANEDTHPCKGCDHCHMDGDCIFKDAIETKLMPKMLEADLLVLVTPLYYFVRAIEDYRRQILFADDTAQR